VWQPRDWLVYARAAVYLTCSSLYCTFRPILPTAAITQWARYSGFMAYVVCSNPVVVLELFITGRPAQPCRYCFYSRGPKWVFRPTGETRCPEIWHGGNFTLIGAEMWEYSPKTVKISNFGQKFVPQGRLVWNIFTKFSAFVRVYRYLLSF